MLGRQVSTTHSGYSDTSSSLLQLRAQLCNPSLTCVIVPVTGAHAPWGAVSSKVQTSEKCLPHRSLAWEGWDEGQRWPAAGDQMQTPKPWQCTCQSLMLTSHGIKQHHCWMHTAQRPAQLPLAAVIIFPRSLLRGNGMARPQGSRLFQAVGLPEGLLWSLTVPEELSVMARSRRCRGE